MVYGGQLTARTRDWSAFTVALLGRGRCFWTGCWIARHPSHSGCTRCIRLSFMAKRLRIFVGGMEYIQGGVEKGSGAGSSSTVD